MNTNCAWDRLSFGSTQSHGSSSVERSDLLILLWHWQAAILIEVFLDFSPESPGGLGGLGPSEPQTKALRFKSLHPMREGGGRKGRRTGAVLGTVEEEDEGGFCVWRWAARALLRAWTIRWVPSVSLLSGCLVGCSTGCEPRDRRLDGP